MGYMISPAVSATSVPAVYNISRTRTRSTIGTSASTILTALPAGRRIRLYHMGSDGVIYVSFAGTPATSSYWALYPGQALDLPFPISSSMSILGSIAGIPYEVETDILTGSSAWDEPVRTISFVLLTTNGSAQVAANANAGGQYVWLYNTSDKVGGTPATARYAVNGTASASTCELGPGGIYDPRWPFVDNVSVFGASGIPVVCLVAA